MILSTPVILKAKEYPKINHTDRMMSLGSCFSVHIGNKLQEAKFNCLINPFGTLYNPSSIAVALEELMLNKRYNETDVFEYNNLWHSWMHHGDFSSNSSFALLDKINKNISKGHEYLKQLDVLFLTFGTSWIYLLSSNSKLVSNCHKVPNRQFDRVKLSVEDITNQYRSLIGKIRKFNPSVKIVFSISPIRHIRDGLVENQISKSTLILAVDNLCKEFTNCCFYFPSYEIVLDELRDYRYYDRDMVHPSDLAIDYIWSKFKEAFVLKPTEQLIEKCCKINKSLNHRPTDPNSVEYKLFLEHLVLEIEHLIEKNPTLDFRKEIDKCHTILNK